MPKQTFFNLPEEKRQHILEAAINEFAEEGYKGASVSSMVARAGIAKGSFYQYFEDKDDLFCYIVIKMIGEPKMRVFQQEKHALEKGSLTDFLRVVCHRQMEELQKRPQLLKIGFDLLGLTTDPIYSKLMAEYKEPAADYFIPYIQQGIQQGTIDPKVNQRLLHFMLTSLGQYFIFAYLSGGEEALSEELIDGMVDDLDYILSHGIYRRGREEDGSHS